MSATLGRLPWRRFLQAIERRFAFTCASNVVAASLVLAMAGGCLSLWLGQDANWDLRNYHLYNGYAALQGRLSLDLAPAQMQSYFSPVLDVFHYLLMTVLPGPVAGFVLGVLHGLLFVPVAGIAWQVLQGRAERAWLAPLLAVAGLCTGTVLAGFGNTMADNTTALFVLGSVWLVLRGQSQGKAGTGVWLGAGTLIGIAVALKLTNAIYAVGLAAAVLVAVRGWGQRLRALLLVTLAALAVAALVTGWWYWQLWQMHGNPLLPQFNAVFQSNMAALVGISDTRWLPRNPGEHLVWPLLFTFNPKRVSEISLLQGGLGIAVRERLRAAVPSVAAGAARSAVRAGARHAAGVLPGVLRVVAVHLQHSPVSVGTGAAGAIAAVVRVRAVDARCARHADSRLGLARLCVGFAGWQGGLAA